MKGSRLKVQTDIIYRSNHLATETTRRRAKEQKKRTKLKSEYESESLRPQPLVHPVLLCLLSCNKWKNAKSTGSPGHNALHIISIRIWEVRLV